ncbi:hypothetical protein [uncultured Roseobacter sp.]|uniref:hypothetical protein n=1 Tax=uncultured Roseobacter sp. TaxID=114847 RepID=UPI002607060C|nr:hypothetical protein [uncultured Roseobacter sp.]
MEIHQPENGSFRIDLSATNTLPPRGEEFIRIVIRFEYALKEIGYCRAGSGEGAEVCWDKFVNQRLGPAFFERIKEAHVAVTILTEPPSKQVVVNERLDWKPGVVPDNIQDLFVAIRRVRNNLLHGGKAGDIDHDRNANLVSESIAVLLEVLKFDEELRMMFEGRH